MKQYTLSAAERKTLIGLSLGYCYPPDGVSRAAWLSALRSLKTEGLARVAFVEGGDVEAASITDEGRAYIEQNPGLHNPVNWSMVSAIAAIATAIIAVVALLIACTR